MRPIAFDAPRVLSLIRTASHYKPDTPAAGANPNPKMKFPQVSVMVLPPSVGHDLQLSVFGKINRRFFDGFERL